MAHGTFLLIVFLGFLIRTLLKYRLIGFGRCELLLKLTYIFFLLAPILFLHHVNLASFSEIIDLRWIIHLMMMPLIPIASVFFLSSIENSPIFLLICLPCVFPGAFIFLFQFRLWKPSLLSIRKAILLP
ncbi:MAG: hypothetical protein ACTSU4_11355 [Promethearchaeota archaeon]